MDNVARYICSLILKRSLLEFTTQIHLELYLWAEHNTYDSTSQYLNEPSSPKRIQDIIFQENSCGLETENTPRNNILSGWRTPTKARASANLLKISYRLM